MECAKGELQNYSKKRQLVLVMLSVKDFCGTGVKTGSNKGCIMSIDKKCNKS